MKVSGSYQFNTTAPKVWAVLTDPKSLSSCIPGCEGLEPLGNNEYQAVMTVGVGPVRGKYNAKISMHDQVLNESYRLVIQGTGLTGFINGEAVITLVEDGGNTTVRVDGESQAGGPIARVGQRMMDSVAKMLMDQFFNCLKKAAR